MLIRFPNICRLMFVKTCWRSPTYLNKFSRQKINVYRLYNKENLYKSLFTPTLPLSSVLTTQIAYVDKNTDFNIQVKRYFSKKKGSKRIVEEESDSDDESHETYDTEDVIEMGDNIVKRNILSLRLDTVLKAALGYTKKKVEKNFYAGKIRLNGEPVTKKSTYITVGDEIDMIKGFSPENSKFLELDRIIVKGIGKVTGAASFPVTLEVLKSLTAPNYENPWSPSSFEETE